MNQGRVYHSKRAATKKMLDWATILSLFKAAQDMLSGVARFLRRKGNLPKLEIVSRFYLGEQGMPSAGTIRLFLENRGKASVRDVLVQLMVFRPRDAYPGHKLFFNNDIGSLESYRKPSFLETSNKTQIYKFRLKPEVFVNPGPNSTLEIVRIIAFAVEYTPPVELDHEIEWTVHCAGIPPTSGRIAIAGNDLKRMLLTSLYESGHVVGYEIPTGKIPESSKDGSGQ